MNTRKPTKKEVPDDEFCWYANKNLDQWWLTNGYSVRYVCRRWFVWLPLDAIPRPSIKQTPRSKP